jgi:hypothetical protein
VCQVSEKNKNKTESSGGIPADPATKTKQKQVPPDIPADPATKTKQKQVPPDIPADRAAKTKQKQVPPYFPAQQKQNKNNPPDSKQKQTKNKFRRIFLIRWNIRRNSAGTFCFVFVFVANLTHIVLGVFATKCCTSARLLEHKWTKLSLSYTFPTEGCFEHCACSMINAHSVQKIVVASSTFHRAVNFETSTTTFYPHEISLSRTRKSRNYLWHCATALRASLKLHSVSAR